MNLAVAPPDDADAQRLDALLRDLQAGVDRAIDAGAAPVDVIFGLFLTVGRAVEGMAEKPSIDLLKEKLEQLVPLGCRVEAAERAARAKRTTTYGGEARRRRR